MALQVLQLIRLNSGFTSTPPSPTSIIDSPVAISDAPDYKQYTPNRPLSGPTTSVAPRLLPRGREADHNFIPDPTLPEPAVELLEAALRPLPHVGHNNHSLMIWHYKQLIDEHESAFRRYQEEMWSVMDAHIALNSQVQELDEHIEQAQRFAHHMYTELLCQRKLTMIERLDRLDRKQTELTRPLEELDAYLRRLQGELSKLEEQVKRPRK